MCNLLQAFATNAWAPSPEEPYPHCFDSWTGARVQVPIGGLIPYPGDVVTADGAPGVVLTPVSLMALADTSDNSVINKVESAYLALNLDGADVEYFAGMINTGQFIRSHPNPFSHMSVVLASLNPHKEDICVCKVKLGYWTLKLCRCDLLNSFIPAAFSRSKSCTGKPLCRGLFLIPLPRLQTLSPS